MVVGEYPVLLDEQGGLVARLSLETAWRLSEIMLQEPPSLLLKLLQDGDSFLSLSGFYSGMVRACPVGQIDGSSFNGDCRQRTTSEGGSVIGSPFGDEELP